MKCVFGILKTSVGLQIKDEMLSWLKDNFDIVCVEQDPPGKLFEYPAIKIALEISVKTNEPVLYIHTKGASNENILQRKIRNLWKLIFHNKKLVEKIFNDLNNIEYPMIICPLSGIEKNTWYNGFIVNSLAANILIKYLKKPDVCSRHYYEVICNEKFYSESEREEIKKIVVYGFIKNDLDDANDVTSYLYSINI